MNLANDHDISEWGLESWDLAAHFASGCPLFHLDVEEEWVADEAISCYNCRYRRWTPTSITCLAKVSAY